MALTMLIIIYYYSNNNKLTNLYLVILLSIKSIKQKS